MEYLANNIHSGYSLMGVTTSGGGQLARLLHIFVEERLLRQAKFVHEKDGCEESTLL